MHVYLMYNSTKSLVGCEADEEGFGCRSKGRVEASAVVKRIEDEDRDGLGGFETLERGHHRKDVFVKVEEDEWKESLEEANSEDELDVIWIPEHP